MTARHAARGCCSGVGVWEWEGRSGGIAIFCAGCLWVVINDVLLFREQSPASPATHRLRRVCGVCAFQSGFNLFLVLEAQAVWRAAYSCAQLNFGGVEPALVEGAGFQVGSAAAAPPEIELSHKSGVRFGERASLAD